MQSSNSSSAKNNASCQVRVGVRVRPLTNVEQSNGGKSVVTATSQTVRMLKRKFTFDSVYDSSISQHDMYGNVDAAGMLESFLDGYNVTIMAYGQTGSGKTFTMGSEAEESGTEQLNCSENDTNRGLIPRFMSDIFSSLKKRSQLKSITKTELEHECNDINENEKSSSKSDQDILTNYEVSASFLEVYGEDIHDLLNENLLNEERHTLPLREDASGNVIVQGLNLKPLKSANDALHALHLGTMNRTTASTLMNLKSSRSHAVFTVYLQQKKENGDARMSITTTSKFTFVDLAGSERMKKTGAEGDRAREGIEINKGLLALGNVINALADEDKLNKAEKVYVPYRQSKLTRLLQDALGGNSQTLFLACVSPSDSNVSETISTLQYANRARNIKNAPTKNLDPTAAELQRLYALTNVLQHELVKSRFNNTYPLDDKSDERQMDIQNITDDHSQIGEISDEIFQRKDVQDYIQLLHNKVKEKIGSSVFDKICKDSLGIQLAKSKDDFDNGNEHVSSDEQELPSNLSITYSSSYLKAKDMKCPLNSTPSHLEELDGAILDVNPDEDLALLDKLLDIQKLDQEFNKEQKEDQEKLNEVEGELEEQEGMLLQLKESLKAYHILKARYETLMGEVQNLEAEKKSLASELERVQLDPTKGCSKAIKKKLATVEASLSHTRNETRKHQQMCRKAEQDAHRCRVLERKVEDLKHGKVALMKKQREDRAKHREFTQAKAREIKTLKRKERKDGQKMSKLESEVQRHQVNLDKRKVYCNKLSDKLKQTEKHLTKILSMREKNMKERAKRVVNQNQCNNGSKELLNKCELRKDFASNTEVSSLVFILQKMVSERVVISSLHTRNELRLSEYNEIMKMMTNELGALQTIKQIVKENENLTTGEESEKIKYHERTIEDLELNLEVIDTDLEDIRSQLPNFDELEKEDSVERNQNEEGIMKMITNLNVPMTKKVLWEMLELFTSSEISKKNLTEILKRKESALSNFENEVERLNKQISWLSDQTDKRRQLSKVIETGENVSDIIQRLEGKITDLTSSLKIVETKESEANRCLENLSKNARKKEIELATVREKLTVMEIASQKDGISHKTAQNTLGDLQSIWEFVGVSKSERDIAHLQIKSSLEDTCAKILDNTIDFQKKKEKEINDTQHNLEIFRNALGVSPGIQKDFSHDTMREHLRYLQKEIQITRPTYVEAQERSSKLALEVEGLTKVMDLKNTQISLNLQALLKFSWQRENRKRIRTTVSSNPKSDKEYRAKIFKDVEEMVKALEPVEDGDISDIATNGNVSMEFDLIGPKEYNEEPPNALSDEFLENCEKDASNLRRLKSKKMVANELTRNNARSFAKKMFLRGRELISLSVYSIEKTSKQLPEYWNTHIADEVCRSIIDKNCIVGVSDSFQLHLDLIYNSLYNVGSVRDALSRVLKEVIEGAYKSLLDTIEGEIDAREAHTSFHDALMCLPSLSKEHIHACIDEMNVLVSTVDSMAQSEVEALAVVWEALNVSSDERGAFWEEIEDISFKNKAGCPFDLVLHSYTESAEEWVLTVLKDGSEIHKLLCTGLIKLEKVHTKLESLRLKQDNKNQIKSLDSEIQIINAKLVEFEERAGKKQKLTTKKINHSSLRKEKYFLNQMQNTSASKLKVLSDLLYEWAKSEGRFEDKDLSEEVRAILERDENYNSKFEREPEIMHMKTGHKKATTKLKSNYDNLSVLPRKVDAKRKSENPKSSSNNGSQNSKFINTPSQRRMTCVGTHVSKTGRMSKVHSIKKQKRPQQSPKYETKALSSTPLSSHNINKQNMNLPLKVKSIALHSNTEPKTLLPFGQILLQTPRNKEN